MKRYILTQRRKGAKRVRWSDGQRFRGLEIQRVKGSEGQKDCEKNSWYELTKRCRRGGARARELRCSIITNR